MNSEIDSVLRKGAQKLQNAFDTLRLEARARLESEILLAHILQVPRIYLHTYPQKPLLDSQIEHFYSLIEQRAQGKPIEYLTYKAQFYGLDFALTEDVLIPRPETEILVDKAREIIARENPSFIAEVGVGSGVITTTLATLHPHCHYLATDINPKALQITRSNINTHAPNANITLVQCSILNCLEQMPHFRPQVILSNPPYIAQDYPLPKPVSFEPANALFAGIDGLEILKLLISESARLKKVWLVCEMGYDQKAPLRDILKSHKAKNVEFYQDLSGLDRGFVAYFRD